MQINVSVVLPVYNAASTLLTTINSVLNQTHKNFELLILDDGSTDDSLALIKNVAAQDERIKFFSRENKGLANTLNELILKCENEFVFRMDADDIALPDRLENQIQYLISNPDVVMVGGQIDFFSDGHSCAAFPMPLDHETIVEGLSEARFPICHPAIAFRRSVALECGLYSVAAAGEDLDFFLKMSEKGKLANIDKKVLSYRISMGSLSVRKYDILSQAYAFALHNYNNRKSGEPELTWDAYAYLWASRSPLAKLLNHLYGLSERFYRYYLMEKVRNNKLSIFYLFLASALRPKTVFSRLIQLVGLKK